MWATSFTSFEDLGSIPRMGKGGKESRGRRDNRKEGKGNGREKRKEKGKEESLTQRLALLQNHLLSSFEGISSSATGCAEDILIYNSLNLTWFMFLQQHISYGTEELFSHILDFTDAIKKSDCRLNIMVLKVICFYLSNILSLDTDLFLSLFCSTWNLLSFLMCLFVTFISSRKFLWITL